MSTASDVWGALANPVRRALLDELRAGPRTTGELVAAVPHLSRFAVMQHLGVLEQAGLLLVRREGRTRVNHVNAGPLEEIRQRWLNRFSEDVGRRAVALRRHLERTDSERTDSDQDQQGVETMGKTSGQSQRVSVASELRIAAPLERVFRALTAEQHHWYPYNYGGERVRDIVFEPRVGGSCFEDWGDGAGHLYGIVTHYDPPVGFTLRGGLEGSTVLENRFELADEEGATVVRHMMSAFGELSDDDVKGIKMHGDMSRFEPQLRAWVEQDVAVR